MAMSCTDAKGKTQPKIITIDSPEKGIIGKPCIDFQPDDRWQIKEDDVPTKNMAKVNDIKSSTNGRRSLRLSSKSNESARALNGESVGSSSDEESSKKCSKKETNVDNGELQTLETRSSKSKRKLSSPEVENKKPTNSETGAAKKMRIDDNNDLSDNCDSQKECPTENHEDSNDKICMPNLSPAVAENKVPKEVKNGSDNIDDAEKTVSEKVEKEISSETNKIDTNDSELLPKLDEFKETDSKSSTNSSDEVKITNEVKGDPDVEIINLDETKKSESDIESDSEVQIIGAEDDKKPSFAEFSTTQASDEYNRLSAGFPFYNSLKEKIDNFKAGDYKPVKFPHTGTLLLAENEVIIESPSLLVPLLIKENDEFPKLDDKKTNGAESSIMRQNMISKRNFFQSSVGQFLINLGMSRVQEWYHRDMKHVKLKQLKASNDKDKDEELEKIVENHQKKYSELKEINAPFNFRMKRCKFCNFKTESQAVMEDHYLTPHLTPRRELRCNFCSFATRDLEAVIFHYEALHRKKANILNNIPFHECTFCSFQHHLKTKVNVHMNRCRKHFIPSQNLAPPFDFEFPGVTTKPVTINDVIGHRRLLLSSAKNQRLPMAEDNNPNSAYARKKLASVLSKITGQNAYPDMKNPNLIKQLMGSQTQMPTITVPSIQLPPGIVITRPRGPTVSPIRPIGGRYPQPRLMTNLKGRPPARNVQYSTNISSTASHLASSGISITPVTRTNTSSARPILPVSKNVTLTPISTASNRTVSQKPGPPQPVALFTNMAGSGNLMGQPQARLAVNVNLRPIRPAPPYQRMNTPPSQVVKGSSGNTFVMCEICDSYIKDLEELRTHMNWVHKVKIHPKMLVSRPPLNCQKCQWRFFTDQGLERHLLGAHGLVTTNMQEMANKNQDGGRCIICGAVFTYKLVSHMTQVHKVTLKPAHLSYKCTVCTATFTLYRLFESHVYNVHSGSAKRSAEDSSSEPPSKKSTSEEVSARKCKECGLVTENMQDHLIKMHIRDCSVKLCRIEKCEKCLYSSDEMLVIRMSDFGLDDDLDDSGDDSSEEDDSESNDGDDKEAKAETVADSDEKTTSQAKTGEQVSEVNSEADVKIDEDKPASG